MKFVLILMAVSSAWAQVASQANTGYRTPEGRQNVAKNLAGSDRDGRQKPKELIAALDLKPGMTVVDLGTGVGYMLPYLSAAVGPTGRVIAADIFEDFLTQAKATAARNNLTNVEFILGNDKDPNLPPGEVDLVLTLDAYHHFDFPDKTVGVVSRALRAGGKFVVVDFYKNGFRDPKHIRLDQADVIREVEGFGYTLASKSDHLPGTQYIAIFTKK
ncbi:MAG: methyltransferase domain-containing protein [Bryobacteraceae bacterium]|nr:methyltransferase domain-containing protein [Bryobacteraceae bacterium]